MTSKRVLELMKERDTAQGRLDLSAAELARIQANCRHVWGPEISDPIVAEAHTIPGDPPGTMGVDWRPAVYVPREETPRWKRTCEECGLTQYTERASQTITRRPDFS